MSPQLQFFAIVCALGMLVAVLELIRQGRLREEYAFVWLASAIAILGLAIFRGSLDFIAQLLDISYAPALLFIIGLGLITLIVLSQTVAISRLTRQNRDITQRVAILEWRLQHELEAGNSTHTETDEPMALRTNITERDLTQSAETESLSDRPRWGYVRSIETLGTTGTATDSAKTHDGGNSRGTA